MRLLVFLAGALWVISLLAWTVLLLTVVDAVLDGESAPIWLAIPGCVIGLLVGIGVAVWRGIRR